MKVSITGANQGLGKNIFDSFAPATVGFSRTNGFDIKNEADRKRIAQASLSSDIFITNAFDGPASQGMG